MFKSRGYYYQNSVMKNKLIIISAFIFLILNDVVSQVKHDYNWLFGKSYSNNPVKGSHIDFNKSNEIDSIELGIKAFLGGNNSNISDKEGNLLLYANGCRIFDSTHHVMQNGDSINYGETWERFCPLTGNYPGKQNTLILPDPANIDRGKNGYYVFHKRLQYEFNKPLYTPELYYSYVDMNGNGGKGEVIEKDEPSFRTTNIVNGYLTACKHKKGRDWWIIQMERDTNIYFNILLTADTIMAVDSQSIGPNFSINSNQTGQAVFTPDGSKFLLYNPQDDLIIYDFNRETGLLSNLQQVEIQDSGTYYGIAVSSNSRFAYLSAAYDMYQIDLWSNDIASSLTHIAHWDRFAENGFPVAFSYAQLAPDCKIYVSAAASTRYLHVINKPNEKGKACDFRHHSIKLPFKNYATSIPNFPHFRIDEEDICDSTITWIPDEYLVKEINVLSVYPNPATSEFTISVNNDTDSYQYGNIRIMDINGEIIKTMDINSYSTLTLDIKSFVPGVYLVEYVSYVSGGRDFRKLVVVE